MVMPIDRTVSFSLSLSSTAPFSPTEIDLTMSFFILIPVASAIVWGVGRIFRLAIDVRDSTRIGVALGFLLTGTDHLVNGESRYVLMFPEFLSDAALFLVIGTGVAEIAGAIGLLVPLRVYRNLGLPNLQRQAGIWLAVMLACVVLANINVADNGQTVLGLDLGVWYFWLRPAFQSIFILWVLYSVRVLRPGQSEST